MIIVNLNIILNFPKIKVKLVIKYINFFKPNNT